MDKLKLTECPRDAMQGLHDFIPTDIKVNYINQLLKVGFDTIDFPFTRNDLVWKMRFESRLCYRGETEAVNPA